MLFSACVADSYVLIRCLCWKSLVLPVPGFLGIAAEDVYGRELQ